MIIPQLGILGDRPWLWAECSDDEDRVRSKSTSQSNPLPFAASEKALTESLSQFLTKIGRAEDRILWLPTVKKLPIASSPLIAEPPNSIKGVTLRPWVVPAIPLTGDQTIELLGAVGRSRVLRPGVIVGQSLAYWVTVFRFAGSLVAREQFLPGLEESDSGLRAIWEPIFPPDVGSTLTNLTQGMPAVCRAITDQSKTPPDVPARTVLDSFMQLLVDGLVRATLAQSVDRKRSRHFDSIHDQWAHALRSDDGTLGDHEDQSAFVDQLRTWRRPIVTSSRAPFRLTFRLEEPEEGEQEGWYLRYLLQATDDPSLMVPAADAFTSRQAKSSPLNREGFDPREYVLATLGEASSIYPPIEASLRASVPTGAPLNVQQAHTFLTESAWALRQAGFHVLLPAWWSRKGTKQRLTLHAQTKSRKVPSGSNINLTTLVKFDWRVALGDDELTLRELEQLAKLKVPLVQIRGRWVEVNPEEIRAALEFWKSKGEVPLRELVRMSLGQVRDTGELDFGGVRATGWVGELLDQLHNGDKLELIEPPKSFAGQLRPYQQRGYSWLAFLRRWGLGACLADDMGLGKTIQTLALLLRDREAGQAGPALLVCPTSVIDNWRREVERFTPELSVMIHHGADRARGASFRKKAEQHALVLSSYALLHRDYKLLEAVAWGTIILDEAQNIKNPETKQAAAARGIPSDHRIALTGTPVENHVGDLWSIMEFLNPGHLGTRAEFRRNFILPIQAQGDAEAADRLKRLTGPFVLRRLKTDPNVVSDLPSKMEMKVYCNLTREQASLYAGVLQDAEEALQNADSAIKRRGNILAILSKLKQVCNHPAQLLGDNSAIPGRSGKLARLTEMIEEILSVDDRALIFTQFTEMGDIIKRHLQEMFGQEVPFLHGGVPKKQRDRMIERFQGTGDEADTHDRPNLFLLSIKAGGTGLNLTAANHVIHFDRWWNPAVEDQATDRAFRIGQRHDVQVHKFVCAGTVEERIDEMIEHKKRVSEKVVGTGEQWLTEMSDEQLRDLFALRAREFDS